MKHKVSRFSINTAVDSITYNKALTTSNPLLLNHHTSYALVQKTGGYNNSISVELTDGQNIVAVISAYSRDGVLFSPPVLPPTVCILTTHPFLHGGIIRHKKLETNTNYIVETDFYNYENFALQSLDPHYQITFTNNNVSFSISTDQPLYLNWVSASSEFNSLNLYKLYSTFSKQQLST